jgi:hypothetical protein
MARSARAAELSPPSPPPVAGRSASYSAAMPPPPPPLAALPPVAPAGERAPHETAGLFRRWTFLWASPLIALGRQRPLQLADLHPLEHGTRADAALATFETAWAAEVAAHGLARASLWRTLYQLNRRALAWNVLHMSVWVVFFLLTPVVFMRRLILYAGPDNTEPVWAGLLLALGVTLSELLRSAFANNYWFMAICLGTRLRSLMFALVYHRVLRLRNLSGYAVGELVNLCSNDGQRLYDMCTLASFLYIMLVLNVCVLGLAVWLVGPWAIVGSCVYLLVLPLQVRACGWRATGGRGGGSD